MAPDRCTADEAIEMALMRTSQQCNVSCSRSPKKFVE